MLPPQPRLHPIRGIGAALLLGVIGAVAPFVMVGGLTVAGWVLHGTSEFDRRYDLAWMGDRLAFPALGCAAYLAAAGWATFAPSERRRFAPTFVILSLASLATSTIFAGLGLPPQRLKGEPQPRFYPAELIFMFGPPLIGAILLSWMRPSARSASLVNRRN